MLADLFQPPRQVCERVSTGNIVDEEGTGRTSVVGAGYALKGFLAGCIPNLKLNVLLANLHRASSEFDTDG